MTDQALSGVKVLDFGWVWAGALLSKQLADNGAQVVRVESLSRPDVFRGDRHVAISTSTNPDDKPMFAYLNTSKYSMTIDLKNPQSRGLMEKLVRWADVISENFTPGTIEKMGYGYERVKQIKPDIIMCSLSAYGQTGPMSREWGLDGTGTVASGRVELAGWPDREPVMTTCTPYADPLIPIYGAVAIVAALEYKRRTGEGQYIDANMTELLGRQITPAYLDWEINGNLMKREGNRIPYAAPHGVFPCKGADRYCAIAIFDEQEWSAFCRVLGDPLWIKDPKFADLAARKQNEDELDALVSEWTKTQNAESVMYTLQAAGVCAGVVQNGPDLWDHDPQLKARDFFVPLDHPVLGTIGFPTPAYKLSKTPALLKPAPCLGEHNEFVCTQLLGISDEEFLDLESQGVFSGVWSSKAAI